jgi:DNA polymerase III subunit epsilon
MKLNNELLVFDLEATSNQEAETKPAHQTNDFIIEVGAVLLDRQLEIVGEFQSLVKPGEAITPFIQGITSITNEMVADQPSWLEVAPQFQKWAQESVKNIKNVRLCPWGNYFDIPLLRKVYQHYGLSYPWSGTAFDCKTIAMLWCALSGRRTDKLSVSAVAKLMGIEPEGQYHRALVDARTQAKIVQRALKDLSSGYFLPITEDRYPFIKIDPERKAYEK